MFAVETVDLNPPDLFDTLDDQLGDSVATVHVIVVSWIGVEQDDLELIAIPGIDQTRCIDHADAVLERKSTARQNESAVTRWHGDRQPRRHEYSASTGNKRDIDPRIQIDAGIARGRIARQRKFGIKTDDLDINHERDTTEPASTWGGRLG
jgi:hypothetical protein